MKKPNLRQFTIATMLCVVSIIAVSLGLYTHWMALIRKEEAAITKLTTLGFWVSCNELSDKPRVRPYPPTWCVDIG